jgi:hypothetical protein
MRNLLAEGVPCSDAVATTAYEFGLITREAADRVKSAPPESGCACKSAARQVLLENFACSAKADKLKTRVDEVWSTVESRSEIRLQKSGDATGNDGLSHDCHTAVPALFDVLLQEISRNY